MDVPSSEAAADAAGRRPVFRPGIRFSRLDLAILVFGSMIAGRVGIEAPWFGIAIGFVVLHFFLFCNVARIARESELVWAAVFVGLAVLNSIVGWPAWPVVLAVSFALAVVLIGGEMRRPSYHGVGWRWINPELPRWWETQAGAERQRPSTLVVPPSNR